MDPGVHLVRRTDFLEHVDDRFVGAAMERPLERANGRGHRRVDVRKRGGRHQRGECRGIETVIGMEDIGQVERLDRLGARLFAVDEVEKMGRLVEVGADGRQRLALARAMEISDDRPHLGGERNRPGQKLFRRLRTDRRVVVKAQHGDARAQDVHRVGILRRVLQEIEDRRRKRARGAEVGFQLLELCLVGQGLMPQEVNDLLVTDPSGQLVDVITGVNKNTFLTHDITETGGGGNDPLESRRSDRHTPQLTSRVPLCHRKE